MKAFITDKQTLDDLNILGRYKTNSIFSMFNHTVTTGGSRLLEQMFQSPLTNERDINERSEIFSFFERIKVSLPFSSEEFEEVENYLRSAQSRNRLIATMNLTRVKLMHFLFNDKEYDVLRRGLEASIAVFSSLLPLIEEIERASLGTPYHEKAKKILELLTDQHFASVMESIGKSPLPYPKVLQQDYILRGIHNEELQELIQDLYELDVYISVSDVSREMGFTYAAAVDKEEQYIDLKGVYHPCIPGAVANDVYIGKDKNVFFLTGANMAGKSTLMKTISISVYLGHMGFPVAAKQMTFSVHDGIYTSINVPDNLSMGYSHFYAEVLRVKHVAEEVASGKQLLIIFDELFKGTNVKDAYDGTVAIVDAFSRKRGTFIISTHIMEAGETLRQSNTKLFYKYLPTVMDGHTPTYPYILEDGITDDRHGMIIIRNEGILEMI
jgi:DNA mismatch repair ATPase MutS